jgi:hypothetical protein
VAGDFLGEARMRGHLISTGVGLLALVLAAPVSAAEAPLLKLFRTVCAEHAFDHPGAEAAARAAGFDEAYSETGKKMKAQVGDTGVVLEAAIGGSTVLALTTGQDPARPDDGVPLSDVSICSITATPGDRPGAQAVVKWVGTAKSEDLGLMAVYGYRQSATGRTAAPDSEPVLVKAALDAGEHRMLVVIDTDAVAGLILQSGRTAKP